MTAVEAPDSFRARWRALALAGKSSAVFSSHWGCSEQCSHPLHPVRGSSDCLGPSPGWAAWLRALHTGAGGKGKGKLGQTLFLMLSPRNSPFNLLPQVQWKEIHFQHGDSGGDLTDWICLGSRICKKCGIRVGIWYQWDHPCPRRREGCIGRCCLSLR